MYRLTLPTCENRWLTPLLPQRLGRSCTSRTSLFFLLIFASWACLSNSQSSNATSTPNATILCQPPIPCSSYLSDSLPCVTVSRTSSYDIALGESICAAVNPANDGDSNYKPSTGTATTRCIQAWKSNGRCDLLNDHANENCEYDGGDCCLATCQYNCANSATLYERDSETCEYFCGEQSDYFCLDDDAIYSSVTAWCQYGTVTAMSECYYTKLDVAAALLECILSDKAHGNEITASDQCGNQSLTCTADDVVDENGCEMLQEDCTENSCCSVAVENGWIEKNPSTLPTLREIYDLCSVSKTEEEIPCFKYMVKCIQENHAAKGGCCRCDSGWSGWRCRTPQCWPKCVHGNCIAPNLCKCEDGWKGADCQHAICENECVAGQGVCVAPNQCECFYGWGGDQCEEPTSTPACVNGEAVAPDICHCTAGWGGRICDYPLCQSWPTPSPDCGMGSCLKPYECECEPGWQLIQPTNGTGFDLVSTYTKGTDITIQTAGTYIFGDSRIRFESYWERIYNSSNAQKCQIPVCRLIFDPRCLRCEPLHSAPRGAPTGGCTECDPGYFVNSDLRCERCSNVFPHCQLCNYITSGAGRTVNLRCTYCEPLYVFEPVAYGEDPTGRCVSDGVIEFSSSVYHAYKNEVNLSIKVQRTGYGLEPYFARPVEVLIRSRDGSAHGRSLEYGGELVHFQFTAGRVQFEVDATYDVSDIPAWGDANYRGAVERRIVSEAVYNISIYDDITFHPGLRYFDIDLFVPPEHLVGHQGPLSPFLEYNEFEPNTGYLPPMDFGRSPTYRQATISTARVYIWDLEEASAPNTTCRGACMNWATQTVVNQPLSVTITARKHSGDYSTSERDRYLVKYVPTSSGNEDAIGYPVEATRVAATPYLHTASYTPTVPGTYKLVIEKLVPGVYAEYWMDRVATRVKPFARPDVLRVDHRLDFYWADSRDAPARARWWFNVHFACIKTDKWPEKFAHGLAVHASPGTTVRLFYQNEGLIEERTVPFNTEVVEVLELNRSACERYTDGTRVPTEVADQFLCHEMLARDPIVDTNGLYSFMVEMINEAPEGLEENYPVFVNLRLYYQNDTEFWAWWPVEQECLLASGLQIQGSPFIGFEALSGMAKAEYSDIKTYEDPPNYEEVWTQVGWDTSVRVDLYDENGATVNLGTDVIDSGGLVAKLSGLDLNPTTQNPTITWSTNHYRVTFVAMEPLDGMPDSGVFTLDLNVYLDGVAISNSPMLVYVEGSITDFWKTQIIGNFTPMKANERKYFQLQTYDEEGEMRDQGGDSFVITFHGPQHDPLPEDLEFEAYYITDNDNGLYDVEVEIQRPGLYWMEICPPVIPTTTTTTTRTRTTTTKTSTATTTTKTTSTTTTTTRKYTTTSSTKTSTTTTTVTTSTSTETSTTATSTTTSTTSTSTTETSTTTLTTSTTTSTTTYTGTTSTSSTTSSTTTYMETSTTTHTVTSTTISITTTSTSTTETTTSTSITTTSTTISSTTSTTTAICIVYDNVLVYDTLSANLTTASGPGVDANETTGNSNAIAGITTTFDVIVKDTYEVQYYIGGANLSLVIDSMDESAGDFSTFHDHEDGSYSFTYQVCQAGLTNMSVKLWTMGVWYDISGSPFSLEVFPGALTLLNSSILGLQRRAVSGFPTEILVELRDTCGNLPVLWQASNVRFELRNTADVANPTSLSMASTASVPLHPDYSETEPGVFSIFFTPLRKGTYSLSAALDGGQIDGSPYLFEVTAPGSVPTSPDAIWLLGSVGASAVSTLDPTENVSVTAGELLEVKVTARDLWGDVLDNDNDTIILGLWREDASALCPSKWRCRYFAHDAVSCSKMPRCQFDADTWDCRPVCLTREDPPAPTLADPNVTIQLLAVNNGVYSFGVNTTVAGTYWCTATVLQPGGWRFYFYDNERFLKRVHQTLLQGPADYTWDRLGSIDLPIPMARFSMRIVGWLKVDVAATYTIYAETGSWVELYINSSLAFNNTALSHDSLGSSTLVLQAGFVPIQLVVRHNAHLTCEVEQCPQDVGFYLRLSWRSALRPWEIIPIDALYYEEPLSEAGNPIEIEVTPHRRAASLAFHMQEDEVPSVSTGEEAYLRLHSADRFGNLLRTADESAVLTLIASPGLAGARQLGRDLVAPRWRISPLANGSYDVYVMLDSAPEVYNISFRLTSLEDGGVLWERGTRMTTTNSKVVSENSFVTCLPVSPQRVGTRVTCTALVYDLEGNEVPGMEIDFVVGSPDGTTWGTKDREIVDTVGRSASFTPLESGEWTIYASAVYGANSTIDLPIETYRILPLATSADTGNSVVVVPDMIVTKRSFQVTVFPKDLYGNTLEKTDDVYLFEIVGGYGNSVRSHGEEFYDELPNKYTVKFDGLDERTTIDLDVKVLKREHNETLSHCPELLPINGSVDRLSRFRAAGSIAFLSCLPGYERAGGAYVLECVRLSEGLGEWRDLEGREADILTCRPIPFYCGSPSAGLVNAELVWRDTRRDVGSRAGIRCLPGFEYVYGDLEVNCSSRNGAGIWLNPNFDEATPVVCAKSQRLCSNIDMAASNAYLTNLSADRDYLSTASFDCLPGYEYAGGSKVVFCDEDGDWKLPLNYHPRLDPEAFSCSLIPNFCGDPAALLGEGDEEEWEYGSRLVNVSSFEVGGLAYFECLEGYEYLIGESEAVCNISADDDDVGRWMSRKTPLFGQLPVTPLRCTLIQDWCPQITIPHATLVNLREGYYLRSEITFQCDSGFRAVNGTEATFRCGHAPAMGRGSWWSVENESVPFDTVALECVKIEDFCPVATAGTGVELAEGDAWPLGSVLTMSCSWGYELSIPEDMSRLPCAKSSDPSVGQWAQHDGYVVSSDTLKCRPRQGYCPELALFNGRVYNFTGQRDVENGTAILQCNPGYRMWIPVTPSASNNWQSSLPWDEKSGVFVDCEPYSQELGVWVDPLLRDIEGTECRPTGYFCNPDMPAFTRRTNSTGGTRQLPLYSTFEMSWQRWYVGSTGSYFTSFESPLWYPNMAIDTTATIACNTTQKYEYSFGDTEAICGLSSDGEYGAWRTDSGRLAVPLHCWYTGTPITDVDVPPVIVHESCFDPASTTLNYTLERSGAIMFWMKPTSWEAGTMIIQGEHGDGKWQVWFSEPGVLQARVAACCRPDWHQEYFDVDPEAGIGHIILDISRNGTRTVGEWYHVTFVWDLGLGLAGLGETKLWVDGELSEPYEQNSDGLDHYTWVAPGQKLHIGAALDGSTTMPGTYSNLRVYGRNILEAEIVEVRGSEEPRCGFLPEVCERPTPINAKLVKVDNAIDPRFALFPLRPETHHIYECLPGHEKVDGDEVVRCETSGAWTRNGTTQAATLLRCCRRATDFCPELELYDGSFISNSTDEEFLECAANITFDPMGVQYKGCVALTVPYGSVSYTNGLEIGTTALLRCNDGYMPERDLAMDLKLHCHQGTFDSLSHKNAVVPGVWLSPQGREVRELSCQAEPAVICSDLDGTANESEVDCEEDPYFCIEPELDEGTFIVDASNGRRIGSAVYFECADGFEPVGGSMTIYCAEGGEVKENGRDGGRWVDSFDRNASFLECRATNESSLANGTDALLKRRWLANTTLECLAINIKMHGDLSIRCDLGPGEEFECEDAVFNWSDSRGYNCETYASEGWCNATGGYVDDWYDSYGDFRTYHNDGFWAPTACCACGGGVRGSGVLGRWVDDTGDTAELPICVLNLKGWCPDVDVNGTHSFVTDESLGHGYGSIATLRCEVGYEKIGGYEQIQCLHNPVGEKGAWDNPPLRCGISPHFCGPIRPTNATIEQTDLQYTLGERISMRCRRGYEYLSGDLEVVCGISDSGYGGVWRRVRPLDDSAIAAPLTCAPVDHYCDPVPLRNSSLQSVSSAHRLGSVVETRCLPGFRDHHQLGLNRRTSVCLHDGLMAVGQARGAFSTALSWASRDLARFTAVVHDLLDYLEEHISRTWRTEDDHEALELKFDSAWNFELRRSFEALVDDSLVRSPVARALGLPDGQEVNIRTLSPWPKCTKICLEILHRNLVSAMEDASDLIAAEALTWYNSFSKLRISFGSPSVAQRETGAWLFDVGAPFGPRKNGYRYGWKCDVSAASLNRGSFFRNRSGYTDLENGVVESDPYSRCDQQEWWFELPEGRYSVEVTAQDPQQWSNVSFVYLQGKRLEFPPEGVPPGIAYTVEIVVDVEDLLNFTCDADNGCTTVNRITIQNVADMSASIMSRAPLTCESMPVWCPPLVLPAYTTVSPEGVANEPQPLGTEAYLSCTSPLIESYGQRSFVCGYDNEGTGAAWRSVGGSQVGVQPDLTCVVSRTVCPTFEPPNSTRIVGFEPPWPELGASVMLACQTGYRAVAGANQVECMEDGLWCGVSNAGRSDTNDSSNDSNETICDDYFLECEPILDFCAPLTIPSAGVDPLPSGYPGAQVEGWIPRLEKHWDFEALVFSAPAGALGEVYTFSDCPAWYRKIHGVTSVICTLGENGTGVWAPWPAVSVGNAIAEAPACELDGRLGLRRYLFNRAGHKHDESTELGSAVVPNLNQNTSEFDSIAYLGFLRVEEAGNYTFTFHACGHFLFSLEGTLRLEGRSRGSDCEVFESGELTLEVGYLELLVQYDFDPILYEEEPWGSTPTPRRLIMNWTTPSSNDSYVVPPEVLRHDFEHFVGFPKKLPLVNDPGQCVSDEDNTTGLQDLEIGDIVVLTDGTKGLLYNPGISCSWTLTLAQFSRVNIFAGNYFEIANSLDCVGDRLTITTGGEEEPLGSFCGSYSYGQVLTTAPGTQRMTFDFVTDENFEYEGFSIIIMVVSATEDDPVDLTTTTTTR